MSSSLEISQVVWIEGGSSPEERPCQHLYSFEQAAVLTQTSVPLLECYVTLGLIEPVGEMLGKESLVRIVRIRRLRRDLGLNLVGAAMVLDMSAEISRLKAQLQAHRAARP